MPLALFLCPQYHLFSTSFCKPFTSSSPPVILKNPKPLNSLSSNATSFFLQNRSFSPTNNKDNGNNNEDVENGNDSAKIKMPTAPWMKGPLLLQPDEVLDFSKPTTKKRTNNGDSHKADRSLTEKISGRRGKKAMTKIVRKIEKLQVGSNLVDAQKNWDDTQNNWEDSKGGFFMGSKLGRKMPWESGKKMVFRRVKREKVETVAELNLDKEILDRFRREGSKMRKWVKVKKAGVTQAVIDEIHSIWANNELVMLKFDLPLCRNMDRAREIVEIKTGGVVVWSKKDSLVAYRGCDYRGRKRFQKIYPELTRSGQTTPSITNHQRLGNDITSHKQGFEPENEGQKDILSPGTLMNINLGIGSTDRSLYEREGDRLLDGLGPRFIDWWYPKPLPVDGDILPEVVPGFKPPFRLCPPHVRPQLTDDELTYLRKLVRPLPVHFVLGTFLVGGYET